jgi:hypothetical protein
MNQARKHTIAQRCESANSSAQKRSPGKRDAKALTGSQHNRSGAKLSRRFRGIGALVKMGRIKRDSSERCLRLLDLASI